MAGRVLGDQVIPSVDVAAEFVELGFPPIATKIPLP
jgi:hypothetical protein